MSGVTAIAGAGGADGLVRTLDTVPAQAAAGLKWPIVTTDTFPLDDSGDKPPFALDCGGLPATRKTAAKIASISAYLPHIAEGIDDVAHEEFVCQSAEVQEAADVSHDLIQRQTAVVHGVAVGPND